MLELLQARKMAEHWCDAWNRRDLDAIMQHYTDNVELNSPFVVEHLGNADGWVRGKDNLRAYFAMGLKIPGLHMELVDVLLSVEAVTILYRRETGSLVADVIELDGSRRGSRVHACYAMPY
jgi:ketosteroid isomerase-like protein